MPSRRCAESRALAADGPSLTAPLQHDRRTLLVGPPDSGKSTLANRFEIASAIGHSRLVPYHARAQEQLQALADARLSVVLAFPILLETYTLILYRLGFRTAATWLWDVRSGCAWINPNAQDYREATALVGRFSDQSISLFAVTLAILASRLNLPVWTYDHHFDAMQAPFWR